jgi:prepilin-type N-terminal cleavage/methylation domain-containing protein
MRERGFTLIELPVVRKRGFTLIELLVVIAILAILISLLTPSLARAKTIARMAICRANMHNAHVGMALYQADNDGWLFLFDGGSQDGPHESNNKWSGHLQPGNPILGLVEDRNGNKLDYLSDARLFWCPLSALKYEESYSPLAAAAGIDKYWGTCSWNYPHLPRSEDPYCDPNPNHWPIKTGKHQNQMVVCSPESSDLLMADAAYWDRSDYPYRAFTYLHFNALLQGGSAVHVSDDPEEFAKYLYGPDLTPNP